MTQDPGQPKLRAPSVWLVCVFVFLVYNSNCRVIHSGDTVPARLIPFTLLLDGTLYLDGWVEPYLPGPNEPSRTYFLMRSHGHWVSSYPILLPLAITPLYVLPVWWHSQHRPRLAPDDVVTVALIRVMEKLSASLIAALSVGLLYLALRQAASPAVALLMALAYGLASNTWAISSQALWRHGFTELGFALFLWALLTRPETRAGSFWAGMGLALAAANKPANGLMAIAFLVYLARHGRQRLWPFLAPLCSLGLLALCYNFYFFGHVLGAVANPLSARGANVRFDLSHSTFLNGFAGLLVSPNRGLLIYTPWIVFSLWGLARLWMDRRLAWGRYLAIALAAIFSGHARFWGWWGGWCYGPRYLTDILPFLAFLLVPVWARIRTSSRLRVVFALSVLAALWVQVVGAYYYHRGLWENWPVNVDRDTSRLWDWSDTEITRNWRAGRVPPALYDDLYLLVKQRPGARARSFVSSPTDNLTAPFGLLLFHLKSPICNLPSRSAVPISPRGICDPKAALLVAQRFALQNPEARSRARGTVRATAPPSVSQCSRHSSLFTRHCP